MIGSVGPSIPLLPQQSRRDLNEAPQEQRREPPQRAIPVADDVSTEQVLDPQLQSRRVEALQEADEGRFRRQREQDELPLGNQQAVRLYQSNQSDLSQARDTGELVGIDVFV